MDQPNGSILDDTKEDGGYKKRKDDVEALSRQERLKRLVVLLGKNLLEIGLKADAHECD